ncbi:MAG: hypothetical protein LBB08_00495 [Rickettsiales bacterium]|jgi:UDP-N-acetylmuramoylalanine--D-glutamate ligase|nr:hypothetical protein [Rickettsiales bacterium]
MKVSEIAGKKVYVWGFGAEGRAVAAFLADHGIPFSVIEPNESVSAPGAVRGNDIPLDAEIVIKSPGISIYKDEYRAAVVRGVKFTSLVGIFLSEIHAQEKRPAVIAITGTKGKTTTASMLAFMLEKLGIKIGLGGNIGPSALDFLGRDLDYVILELSSFQAASLEDVFPDYAIVVSISPAHLDWHQNFENYKRDKLRFLPNVKRAYLCGEDDYLRSLNLPNARNYGMTSLSLPTLQVYGRHNILNLSGALELMTDLGLDTRRAVSFLSEFEPIDHRLKKVHEADGITFIDDSIATVAESTIAGIRAFAGCPIAVIVGGFDNKSANYGELSKFVTENADVKILVGLPETGALIQSSKLKMVGSSMREAVDAAVAALPHGGVVLLSPAAQSFNMYKNYKERGLDFERCAKGEI